MFGKCGKFLLNVRFGSIRFLVDFLHPSFVFYYKSCLGGAQNSNSGLSRRSGARADVLRHMLASTTDRPHVASDGRRRCGHGGPVGEDRNNADNDDNDNDDDHGNDDSD